MKIFKRKNRASDRDITPTHLNKGGGFVIDKSKPKKKKKWWLRVIQIILVLIVLLIGWMGYNFVKALDQVSEGGITAQDVLSLINPNATTLKGEERGYTNFLILGYGGENHPGGTLSDTNIFVSYNWDTKQVSMVSFPRDLYTTIARDGGKNKLNYAYSYGIQNEEETGGGGTVASETIANISGQPIDYYIAMDFVGFKDIVDAMGGITVNVEKAIYDPYYPADNFDDEGNYSKSTGYRTFKIAAGEQTLDGITALRYARSRYTTSDFDRAARQQKIITAIKDKALSTGFLANPAKLVDTVSAFGEHVTTNMKPAEMEKMLSEIKDVDTSTIQKVVLDNSTDGLLTTATNMNGYYLVPKGGDFDDIQEMIKELLGTTITSATDGTTTSSVSDGATLSIGNSTGTAGYGGKLQTKVENVGFTVVDLYKTTETTGQTVLYDYTNGKDQASINALLAMIPDLEVIRRQDGSGSVDFKLILGSDYKGV